MKGNKLISLYIPKELNDVFEDIKSKDRLNTSKNAIIIKCIAAGLKEVYKIDFENDDLS